MSKQKLPVLGRIILSVLIIAIVLTFQWSGNIAKAENNKSFDLVAPAATLCSGTEQTIWSCSTIRNKVVSVCASKGLTAEKGYVQYRFGLPGKVELEVPKDRSKTLNTFKYARYTRYRVTMLMLKFENQGFIYEVHDDDNEEEKTAIRSASVDITNSSGKAVSSVTCKLPIKGSLMKLEGIIPNDENAF